MKALNLIFKKEKKKKALNLSFSKIAILIQLQVCIQSVVKFDIKAILSQLLI